jgi:hypothetical protein
MAYKVFVSYLNVVAFVMMVVCVVANGGLVYMVYPMALFGVALCEEEKPGRNFWYFIILYTQAIVIV